MFTDQAHHRGIAHVMYGNWIVDYDELLPGQSIFIFQIQFEIPAFPHSIWLLPSSLIDTQEGPVSQLTVQVYLLQNHANTQMLLNDRLIQIQETNRNFAIIFT